MVFAFGLDEADPDVFWGVLYVIPIVLVAHSAGAIAGLTAGGLALGLVAAWAQIKGVDLGARGYLVRAAAFLVVGWVAGVDARGTAQAREEDHAGPVGIVDAAVDVLELNDREARRRESQNLVGLGTWEMDLGTGAMAWSEEFQTLYGVDPDRFVSSRSAFEEIVHPEDREIVSEALARIARDETTSEIRYRIMRPGDGDVRWIRCHIHSQADPAGRPVRVLGTGQDVTDLVMVLSPREGEIMMLLAEGLSGDEIAKRLHLSPATVRTHIQNAMGKLGAHTRGQAIATAIRSEEIGS